LSGWTGVFYTGNWFKQLQLTQVMSGEQEGFLKRNLVGDQILMLCNKMQIIFLKIIQCDFCFRFRDSQLKST